MDAQCFEDIGSVLDASDWLRMTGLLHWEMWSATNPQTKGTERKIKKT